MLYRLSYLTKNERDFIKLFFLFFVKLFFQNRVFAVKKQLSFFGIGVNLFLIFVQRKQHIRLFGLALAAGAALVLSCATGTAELGVADVFAVLKSFVCEAGGEADFARTVIAEIRLPRGIAALFCGIALGTAGAALQGLFRNPLADPGLIGVSSGGALGALSVFAFAGTLLAQIPAALHVFALPLAAMLGALAATLLVLALAGSVGRHRIGGMLLIGIAINSAAAALTGLILHFSADNQIRTYTFWMLGGLDRAEWSLIIPVAIVVAAGALVLPRFSRELDVLALGESEAHFAGIDVARLKKITVWVSALMVGAAVAIGGMIGFVGLVAPHLIRLIFGPSHRFLVPASGLLGGILLIVADIAARTFGGVSELPIGVVTAIIGAPFFLSVLLREERRIR